VVDPQALAVEWRRDILREDHEDRVARPRTDDARRKMQDREDRRQSFTTDAGRAFFESPLYSGSASKARRTVPGSYVSMDVMWWTGLILGDAA